MNFQPLRSKLGFHRYWSISGTGDIVCTLDPDFAVPTRYSKGKKQYIQVQLKRGSNIRWFYVHRLMAYSWLGSEPHPLRIIVDHKNGNSLDNRVENLRWVTYSANNINVRCYGLVQEDGTYYPRIAGFIHRKFGTPDEELAKSLRGMLVECYVRYNTRFPDSRVGWPHYSIHTY